MLIIKDIGG